jgi:hypothetical protein
MIICDFCIQFQEGDKCGFGLRIPKKMSCPEFDPGIERFCSDASDFTNAGQIVQMASFFEIKGREMKKVRAMAALAETRLHTARVNGSA